MNDFWGSYFVNLLFYAFKELKESSHLIRAIVWGKTEADVVFSLKGESYTLLNN